MPDQQITLEERYQLAQLRALGLRPAAIARRRWRHRAVIGKLAACTAQAVVARLRTLLGAQPRPVRTLTADNGREMTGYR